MKEHEGIPCHGCPVKEFPAIKSICPCRSYEKYLDALFVEKKDVEPNELMHEIRTDAPSPIMQGKEE